jgi:hypothetical protein
MVHFLGGGGFMTMRISARAHFTLTSVTPVRRSRTLVLNVF